MSKFRNPTYHDDILFAKKLSTTGGAATESFRVSGAEPSDLAIVTLASAGAVPVTILSALCSKDSVDVTFSGDPSSDHVINVVVVKE